MCAGTNRNTRRNQKQITELPRGMMKAKSEAVNARTARNQGRESRCDPRRARHPVDGSGAHENPDPQPAAAQPGLGGRARSRGRRAARRVRQRHARSRTAKWWWSTRSSASVSPTWSAPPNASASSSSRTFHVSGSSPVCRARREHRAYTGGGLAEVTLALLAIVALIAGLAWLMKRMRGFGTAGHDRIQVLSERALGPKERCVLVRVGATEILIGVASGGVNTLHVFRKARSPNRRRRRRPRAGESEVQGSADAEPW